MHSTNDFRTCNCPKCHETRIKDPLTATAAIDICNILAKEGYWAAVEFLQEKFNLPGIKN